MAATTFPGDVSRPLLGQHTADGMASGFGMAGDAAGAAVLSKAILARNQGGPVFF